MPSGTRLGPVQDLRPAEPIVPVQWRSPRGSSACTASMPQCQPRPGASSARASGEPTITASAPHAIALTMSPLRPIDPSAITCT